MDRAIEAATAAMRSVEAAMSKLLERDRSLHDVEEAGCVLQQLRIALDALVASNGDGAEASSGAEGGAASHRLEGGGQPLPDRATEGRPPIDA